MMPLGIIKELLDARRVSLFNPSIGYDAGSGLSGFNLNNSNFSCFLPVVKKPLAVARFQNSAGIKNLKFIPRLESRKAS